MRAQSRRAVREEEEESVFVSMTDMTVGFLFIIMILLVFFASQVRSGDVVPRSALEAALLRVEELEQDVQRLSSERNALVTRAAARRDRIEELEQLLRERNEQIAELQRQLASLQLVDPLEEYLARVADTRRDILERLRDAIRADFPDLQVELSEDGDALRFQGEGLFRSGAPNLLPDKRDVVRRLAERLNEVLPCFTTGPVSAFDAACNPHFVMIEAVQIEGHTDNVGSDNENRILSTNRANNTFFLMTDTASTLKEHRNLNSQPVLSVAAYGFDRPVASNDTLEGRATNRRIDLRFIMVTPRVTEGIDTIRDALLAGTSATP